LADQRPGGDGLRVGEPEAGQGERVRLLTAGQSGEDGVQRAAQPARALELVGPAGSPGDAHPLAPAFQSIRFEQHVLVLDDRLLLGPIRRIGEVQGQRTALQFDRFRRWRYHCEASIR